MPEPAQASDGGELWRDPDFPRLFAAATVSNFGSMITALALPLLWYAPPRGAQSSPSAPEETMGRATLLALAAACALAAAPASADDAKVTVGHNKLDPATLTVKAGATVTFVNVDEMPGGHSLAADDGSFTSPALAKDASWSHTFTKPGSYPYAIQEHRTAKGTIVVE